VCVTGVWKIGRMNLKREPMLIIDNEVRDLHKIGLLDAAFRNLHEPGFECVVKRYRATL
jgi:hypothetical protein